MKEPVPGHKCFTLTELLVTVVISSFIITGITLYMISTVTIGVKVDNTLQLIQDERLIRNELTAQLRAAHLIDFLGGEAGLRLDTGAPEQRDIKLAPGGQLVVEYMGPVLLVAENVEGFSVTKPENDRSYYEFFVSQVIDTRGPNGAAVSSFTFGVYALSE